MLYRLKDYQILLKIQRYSYINMTLLASSRRLTTIVKEAHCLHQIELREKEHLKFLHLLLKDFMIKYGIDTENWILVQFATPLKIIVLCPWSIRLIPGLRG
ncbi:hypothetical protein ACQJBY_032537 [Aegilops geniculata]